MFQAILITALLCTVSGKVLSEEEQMKVTKVQVALNTPDMSSVEVPAEVVEVVNDQKVSNTVGVIPVEMVMKKKKEMGTSSKMPVMPVGVVPVPTVSNTVGVIPVEVMKEKKETETADKMPVMPVGVVPMPTVSNTADKMPVISVGAVPMPTVVTKMPKVVVGPSMQMPMNTPTNMDVVKSSDPCDLQCTKLDLNPVCASSDLCIYEFPNKCVMDTYNCKHPEMNFKESKDERCKMYWLKHCTEKDLMG